MSTSGAPVYLYPDFVTKFTFAPGIRTEITELEANNKNIKIMFAAQISVKYRLQKCFIKALKI